MANNTKSNKKIYNDIMIFSDFIFDIYMDYVHAPLWKAQINFEKNKTLKTQKNKIAVFDTSISTDNIGDFIIMDYCNNILKELFPCEYTFDKVPVQRKPNKDEIRKVRDYYLKFVCGTNLLRKKMSNQNQWKFRYPISDYNNLCLLGVGWNSYDNSTFEKETIDFYKNYLSKDFIHSVRDNYSKQMLESIGIKNILNTSCPSMWKLTRSFCKDIPKTKSNKVITTITDYCKDLNADNFMIDTLCKNYKTVYLWIQGDYDLQYLDELSIPNNIILVNQTLSDYDDILKNNEIDYVGTRLHAGIRALNHKRRSIIISIDNRAKEIANDTNLPIIERNNIYKELDLMINSSFETKITIPEENIKRWKEQFNNFGTNY